MKNLIIAACVAVIAIGGSISVFAASDPVVDVRVWQSVTDEKLLYVSTKPAGGSWTTHNTALDMSEISASGHFRQSNFISVDANGGVTVAGSSSPASADSSDASSTTTHPTLGTQTSAGYWTVDEETDPITDARIVWATTIASAVVTKDWGYSTYDTPAIGVRCNGATLEGFVHFDTFIAGSYSNNDRVPVIYRVDDQSAVQERWYESTSNVAIFAPQPEAFTRALLTGSQLVVRATSYDDSVITLTVRVAGLASVLGNLPCYRPSSG